MKETISYKDDKESLESPKLKKKIVTARFFLEGVRDVGEQLEVHGSIGWTAGGSCFQWLDWWKLVVSEVGLLEVRGSSGWTAGSS